jgi:hypothetical protein
VGDWIISNGTAWEKVDLTDAVSSVFGRTGAVVGASTDYSSVGLTNTAIGASSPSTGAFTTVTASSTIAATGAVTGSNLSGTNTGDQTNITGNAATATALQTARAINGVSFDGTAAITVTAAGSTLSDTVTIAKGGTGQITAQAALNALLPSQAGASGKNLQSDGTNVSFVADAGGTVTSVSVSTANGVSGTVATSTTTPAISLTLGAITPTSVAASGSVTGSNLSGTNTGDQTISITGDVTAAGSTGVLTASVTKINGTSLAGLTTGLLKNTTTTGVPTIAVSGTDYAPPTSGTAILYGNNAGGFSNVTVGSGLSFSSGTLASTSAGGSVTSVSVTTANGVSGTVTNPTSTPDISLTLGAITPSSVNSVVLSGSATPTLAVTGTSSISGTSSGTNTGDQTITLTGGVTGSGTGSFAATVVTNANLTGAVTSVGNATSLGSFSSANLSAALTDETGSGAAVFATSPTLVTPILGTPSSGTLSSCTGLPISTGVSGLGTGIATALAVNSGSTGAPALLGSAGAFTTLSASGGLTVTGNADTTSTFRAIAGGGGVSQLNFVGNTGNLNAQIQYDQVASNTGQLFFGTNLAGTFATRMTLTSTGLNSTAIGATTASTGAFTSVDSTGTITSTGASTQFRAKRTGQNADFRILQGVNNTVLDNNNGDELNLAIAGTYRATLSSTGLAVTGALSATGALSITATAASSISRTLSVGALIASGNLSGLGFVPNSTGLSAGYNYSGGDAETNMIFGASSSSQQMRFQRWDGTTLTNVLTLVGTGNVGIGTTSPGAKLDISGNIRLSGANPNIEFNNGGGMVYGPAANTLAFATGGGPSSPVERARIDSSGNLLVGTTTVVQSSQLTVSGSLATNGLTSHAGTGGAYQSNKFNFEWTGSAALWVDGTNIGNIATSSDYRIKKNVTTQTASGLERVMQLRPVSYEYTDYKELFKADGVVREGFIAHEVQEVIPSGAQGAKDEENQIQSLRVDAILSVTVKALQELNANLVAQVAALSQRLAALETK